MTEPQKSDDEKQRDEILRRMLKTPPRPHKPHKPKNAEPKPGVSSSNQEDEKH